MTFKTKIHRVGDIINVTDYVANGSFASLKDNVTYLNEPGHAVLIRLTDYNNNWSGRFIYVNKKSYDFLKKSSVSPNEVIISNVGANFGTVFKAPQLNLPMTLGPNTILLKPNENYIDQEYLYYSFISPIGQQKINNIVSGSAQPKFNKTDFRNLKLELPPLEIQKRISRILSTLDNKIELNKKINQTLESITQAIFKSWFVDFDPVHAKASASCEDEYDAIAKELGIPREILNLFPSEFQDTELGVIPKGWEITQISKISKLNPESWSKKKFPSVLNYIDLTSVKEGNITEIIEYTYETAPSRARRVLKRHDTIIGTVRPGNKSYAYINEEGLTGSTGFAVIRPLKEHYRAFIYLYLTQESVIAHFAHIADGGAYPAIRPEIVTSLKLCKPTEDLLTSFQNKISVLFDKIFQNKEEQKILLKIRDMLLPKLISGEIEVSNLNLEPEHD